MTLDPEIVRELLLTIERDHKANGWELVVSSQDYPRFYVAKKLWEGGFIHAEILPGSEEDEEAAFVKELTCSGHAFLDTIRDPKAWAVVKRIALRAGGISAQTLWQVASGEAVEAVKKIISDV